MRSELTKKQMSDPIQREMARVTLEKAHVTIDHSSDEWTKRSIRSNKAIAASIASSKTPESRLRASQRELAKGAEYLSENGKKLAMKALENGIKKYGSEEAYRKQHSDSIKGRVKIKNIHTGQIKMVKCPDMNILVDWILVIKKVYEKTGPNPIKWYHNPTTHEIKNFGKNLDIPPDFIPGRGPRKYWSTK